MEILTREVRGDQFVSNEDPEFGFKLEGIKQILLNSARWDFIGMTSLETAAYPDCTASKCLNSALIHQRTAKETSANFSRIQ